MYAYILSVLSLIVVGVLAALELYPTNHAALPHFTAFVVSESNIDLLSPPSEIDDVPRNGSSSTAGWQNQTVALLAQNDSNTNGLYTWQEKDNRLTPLLVFTNVGDFQLTVLYGSNYGNSLLLYNQDTKKFKLALSTAIVNSVTQVGDLYVSNELLLRNAQMNGELNGVDVDAFNARLNGIPDNIADVSDAECDQIANIDSTLINSSAWTNAGYLDQNVSTTGTPTFGTITSVQPFSFPQSVTIYESSGTVDVPSGAKAAMVQIQGGGGAGGGQGTSNGSLGGGGGSGSFVQITFQVSDISVQTGFDFTIGAGGAKGAGVSDDGGNGGDTILAWKAGATIVTAPGGGGGKSGATNGRGGLPGVTPTVTGSFSNLVRTGNWGFKGFHPGSAIVNVSAGDGADALYGAGGRGGYIHGASEVGLLGGGGGGGFFKTGVSRNPSNGGNGYVRVFWF